MARPNVEKDLQRTVPVKSYWTEEEIRELRRRAAKARLSVSAYLRNLALGDSIGQKAA